MSISSRIVDALKSQGALCDDCLSEATSITPRQSINVNCRSLQSGKLLARPREDCARCGRVKIVNRLVGHSEPKTNLEVATAQPTGAVTPKSGNVPEQPILEGEASDRPWYWEGNVQKRIVQFLIAKGQRVASHADTSTREQGKDIVAENGDGRALWITVKGFPEKSQHTQARHWFAGALLDLARYRDEDGNAVLAMGLPRGFKTYEGLISRTDAVRVFLGYRVYWVKADGSVICEESS